MKKNENYDPAGFYDKMSGSYDEMFDFAKDLETAENVVAGLKKQFGFTSALDIGCGTGSFTVALARGRVKAVGMDLSQSMLDTAKKNSLAYGLDIAFVNSGMDKMVCNMDTKFDLIMCMGNTLPHLPDKEKLYSMLIGCKQLLHPGGHLVLNLLNYDRILRSKERIVGITRNKNHEFIRFYDFRKPYVNFNILEIDWNAGIPSHKIISTQLYPYTNMELKSALAEADFKDFSVYGGLKFERYNPEESRSILITAVRG